jgi:hypothetical protein
MKLFSATLHGEARRWYHNLPAASITSMDQFEEIFLARWVLKLEDIQSLLKGLECIKQTEYETVRVFGVRFQRLLYQILESHCPKGKYLMYLYTNGLLGHLSFLLNKKGPKTLTKAHNMATQIEVNLSLSKTNDHTTDTLSLIKLVSSETFTDDSQERREQVLFDQQNEDVIKEQEPKQDDKASTCAPPSDQAIQGPISPAQQKNNEDSRFPFQDPNDTSSLDSENEGEMETLRKVPCCTIKDGVIPKDENVTHAKNTEVLEAPT